MRLVGINHVALEVGDGSLRPRTSLEILLRGIFFPRHGHVARRPGRERPSAS